MTSETKPCPVCGETIKAVAIKCRFCNTDLVEYRTAQEAEVEHRLFSGHPAVVYSIGQWFLIVLTVGIAYLVYWVKSISTTYTLTTQRVQIERGIFSKLKTNAELFRLDDFDLHRPFGMRLLGHATLHLRSSDPDQATIIIYGIPDLEALADTLRECALRERTRRRVTTFVDA